MTRPRVFITQPIARSAVERLRAFADVDIGTDTSRIMPREEVLKRIAGADILFHHMHDVIDAGVIAAAPRLKLIASQSIIPATVDIKAATARKIPVTTIPAIVTEATADMCWALLMAVARRVCESDAALRRGVFPGSQSNHFNGGAVHGKTIGIVGMGRIGSAVARRARGFDMKILYTKRNRYPEAYEHELGATYVSLDELMSRSDFVSVNPLLTPETVHLVGARQLALMKPTAYLVNTSRGPVVDEAALAAALAAGRIAGAALDVYEQEPKVHPELVKLPNVVLSPHTGSAVTEMRDHMANVVVDGIEAVVKGQKVPNVYNPEVLA